MSTIEALKDYILDYEGLATDAAVSVEAMTTKDPQGYAVFSLPGQRVISTYINGATLCEFPFAIQSTESTADELERIENSGFYEALAEWFDSQTIAGSLPTLDTGKTAISIAATGWGFIYEQGESGTGIYQIQGKLTYEQDAPA